MAFLRSRTSAEEDDEYWGQTSKKTLTNPFDFEDDVTDFEDSEMSGWLSITKQQQASEFSKAFREQTKNIGDDDSDTMDVITWDGTKTGELKSARYRPHGSPSLSSSTSSRKSSPASSHVSVGRHSKTSSHVQDEDYARLPNNYAAHIGSSNNRSGFSSTPKEPSSIAEAVNEATPRSKPLTATEYAKLETQVKFLTRSLESAQENRWSTETAEKTIKRLIAGQPCSLELHKSLSGKLALLDEAVRVHDGNAITAVLLFLRNTLKKTLFVKEVKKRPDAVGQYLYYLKCHYELSEMADFLKNIGNAEEAAMLKYKQALGFTQPEDKLRNLQNCYRGQFKDNWSLSEPTEHLQDHCALLERQVAIEKNDARLSQEAQYGVFKSHPRVAPLPFMPAITTLFYCCMYHYEQPENSIASPFSIRRDFRLSENQFLYTALTARAKLQKWGDIESLLTGKGWFGGKKMKASIGFEKVVDILNKMNAPKQVLDKYLLHIDDTDLRLSMATKFNCPHTVIETLLLLKDRQALLRFENKLPPRSAEAIRLETILRNSSIKWKN